MKSISKLNYEIICVVHEKEIQLCQKVIENVNKK